jgi:FMN phosphatase YigB (HAD superfamily)
MGVILTDADEVILKWFPAFKSFIKSYHNIDYPINDDRRLDEVLGYDLAFKLIDEFNNTPKHFANLHAYEDALIYLPKLYNEGWKIVVITACGTDNKTYIMRKTNLEAVFGNIFEDILTVNYLDSKLIHLNKYMSTWWIDDSFKHIEAGLEAGHKCIHLARVHDKNIHHPNVKEAKDWKNVYNIIHGTD